MRNLILGTDWGEDCDDCVALRLLARHHKAGKIRLLGVCINTCDKDSAASLYGFLNYEGVSGIPVGVDKRMAHLNIQARYQARLAKYAPDKTNDDAEDAVRLYRRLLVESDGPVEIMEIGFLHSLSAALLSEGDDISPKTGMELFKEKVEKLWIMGGRWDVEVGKDYNFNRYPEACAAAAVICEKCPCPMTFLGWEIGANLITGDKLESSDPLHMALCDHGSGNGRESWDPMLVLMAIIGDERAAGYSTVNADVWADPATGSNFFRANEDSPNKFVIKDHEDSYYSDMINELIK